MTTIFAVIVFGAIFLVGVIVAIVGFSFTKSKTQQSREGELPMITSQNQNFDLITLPGGATAKVPKEFDPDLIMRQLADIQNAPNLISAYVCELLARFRANREIKFLNTIEKYGRAVAGGMAAQAEVLQQQLNVSRLQMQLDPENQELEMKIYKDALKKKAGFQEVEVERLNKIKDETKRKNKPKSDPYTRAFKETERGIASRRGKQDAIRKFERKRDAEIQEILKGRDENQLPPSEQEKIRNVRRYYNDLIAPA